MTSDTDRQERQPSTRNRSRATRRHRREPNPRTRAWVPWVAGALLVFVVSAAGWAIYSYASVARNLAPADKATRQQVANVLDEPTPPVAGSQPEYVLILGADRRPGQKRARSDSILLMRVDRAKRDVSLLSIPRDSRVLVEGHDYDKITHANAYGGPALAVTTVKDFTGLPVNHYVEIDFAGFADVVDALGGVTVNVDREIDDKHGANTGGVSDVTYIPAGEQRLDGAAALTFVRSRAYADGDFTRIRNQQKFLKALATAALERRNLIKLPKVINSVSKHTETDMSVAQIISLANDFRGFSGEEIRSYTVPGSPQRVNGISYVVPHEQKAEALFSEFATGSVTETP